MVPRVTPPPPALVHELPQDSRLQSSVGVGVGVVLMVVVVSVTEHPLVVIVVEGEQVVVDRVELPKVVIVGSHMIVTASAVSSLQVLLNVVVESVKEQPVVVNVVEGEQADVMTVELPKTVEEGSQMAVTHSAVFSLQDAVLLIVVVKSVIEHPVAVVVVDGVQAMPETVDLLNTVDVGSQK